MQLRLPMPAGVGLDRSSAQCREGSSESIAPSYFVNLKACLSVGKSRIPCGALLGCSQHLNKTVIYKVIKVLFL